MTSPFSSASAINLAWPHGTARVSVEAAILEECVFALGGGEFRPLARAPWVGRPDLERTLPAHLRRLGGEFVAVPFGTGGFDRLTVAPPWDQLPIDEAVALPHGPSANATWTVIEASHSVARLRLLGSSDEDVAAIERTIRPDPLAPALDFTLTITPRRSVRLPIGLHPILRLPDTPGGLRIASDFGFGICDPAAGLPAVAGARPGATFTSLGMVPSTQDEAALDLASLPLPHASEVLLQLCHVRGPVTAWFCDEGAAVRLCWDTAQLPSCILWLSDQSWSLTEGGAKFRGLGVEPVASAFSFPPAVSIGENPLSRRGVATAIALPADRPTVFRYRLEAFAAPMRQ